MQKFENLEQNSYFKAVSTLFKIFGIFGSIWTVCVWMNWIPGFEFKRIRSDTVLPQVYLFPADRVRLHPNFVDKSQQNEISWAKWSLKKYDVEKYKEDGLEPTIIIPESEGGIYQLEVRLKLSGETKERFGSDNIYVVQDIPKTTKTSSETSIPTSPNITKELIEKARSGGIEIYHGKEGWQTIQNAIIKSDSIVVPKGTELSSFQGQVIWRAKGTSADLSGYSTFPVPADEKIKKANLFNEK